MSRNTDSKLLREAQVRLRLARKRLALTLRSLDAAQSALKTFHQTAACEAESAESKEAKPAALSDATPRRSTSERFARGADDARSNPRPDRLRDGETTSGVVPTRPAFPTTVDDG